MGGEFAQFAEWNYEQSLDWHLLEQAEHRGVQNSVKTLNKLYRDEPSLHRNDVEKEGFSWVDEQDASANVISFIRKGARNQKPIVVVCNFSDKEHIAYPLGLPSKGEYMEIFNSNDVEFGGYSEKTNKAIKSSAKEQHGRKNMLEVNIPPLSVIYLKKV